MNRMEIRRLYSGDTAIAVSMFSMMALVLGEIPETLSLNYVESLLMRNDFWAIAALEGRLRGPGELQEPCVELIEYAQDPLRSELGPAPLGGRRADARRVVGV